LLNKAEELSGGEEAASWEWFLVHPGPSPRWVENCTLGPCFVC